MPNQPKRTVKARSAAKDSEHPEHKAREIKSICSDAFIGWSIYPEQLPAMVRRMQRDLTKYRVNVVTGVKGDSWICQRLLEAIGLKTAIGLTPATGRKGRR